MKTILEDQATEPTALPSSPDSVTPGDPPEAESADTVDADPPQSDPAKHDQLNPKPESISPKGVRNGKQKPAGGFVPLTKLLTERGATWLVSVDCLRPILGDHANLLLSYCWQMTSLAEGRQAWLTIPRVCRRLDISPNTARKACRTLEGRGLVSFTPNQRRQRLDLDVNVEAVADLITECLPKGEPQGDPSTLPEGPAGPSRTEGAERSPLQETQGTPSELEGDPLRELKGAPSGDAPLRLITETNNSTTTMNTPSACDAGSGDSVLPSATEGAKPPGPPTPQAATEYFCALYQDRFPNRSVKKKDKDSLLEWFSHNEERRRFMTIAHLLALALECDDISVNEPVPTGFDKHYRSRRCLTISSLLENREQVESETQIRRDSFPKHLRIEICNAVDHLVEQGIDYVG